MNSKSSLRWTCCRCRPDLRDKNWNPQRCTRTRRTDRVLRILTRVAAFLLASTSALLITRYDPAWDRRRSSQPRESGSLPVSTFRLQKTSDESNTFPWIPHPSPAIFTIAWAVFALSAATIYHLQRHDRHQNHILAVTIASGVLGGFVISKRSLVAVLGIYLPICVSLGLLFSALVHGLRKPRSGDVGQEEQEEEPISEKEQLRG